MFVDFIVFVLKLIKDFYRLNIKRSSEDTASHKNGNAGHFEPVKQKTAKRENGLGRSGLKNATGAYLGEFCLEFLVFEK